MAYTLILSVCCCLSLDCTRWLSASTFLSEGAGLFSSGLPVRRNQRRLISSEWTIFSMSFQTVMALSHSSAKLAKKFRISSMVQVCLEESSARLDSKATTMSRQGLSASGEWALVLRSRSSPRLKRKVLRVWIMGESMFLRS